MAAIAAVAHDTFLQYKEKCDNVGESAIGGGGLYRLLDKSQIQKELQRGDDARVLP